MGDVVVSAIVSEIVGRLTSAAVNEFGLLRAFKSDISALRKSFIMIQAVLLDAEAKQRKEKAVEEWLRRLRCASFEVENVLDEVSTQAMLRRLDAERGFNYRVGAFFSSHHNPISFRVRIAHKVKHLREELDSIAAERSKFDLTPTRDVSVGGDMMSSSRQTSSLVNESEVYGREEEKEMITRIICDNQSGDDVGVYAIWGMGGIGKTTLAQLVYNDQRVKNSFDLKGWVCVSDDFDVLKLTRAIIESVEGNPCTLSQLDPMQIHLQEALRGKKFLLVLDDVWNEDRTKWDVLRRALNCGAEGSLVLATTRFQTIATMMAKPSEFVHQIGCLSNEDSWSLFSKLAFGVGREGAHLRELEPIGRDILEKCKGLPLAVKSLGSMMWSKSSIPEWKAVKESEVWDLPDDGSSILPALKLSYDNLPPHVKQCFAFCCMFPKDYLLSKYLLIMFWIGNGFVPSRGEVDLYVLGEEIFNCLLRRSFFQDGKDWLTNGYRQDFTCKMHDLMHDLARSVMGHECSFIDPGMVFEIKDALLHFSSSWSDYLSQDLEMLRLVRTIFIDDEDTSGIPRQITSHKFLRVLDLKYFRGKTLPQSISYLKHLRYLSISHSHIEVLPELIIYLQNLQGLHLRDCFRLCKLPEGMRYMRNLHYLDLHRCLRLQHFPAGMGQLKNLRHLSKFIVGKKSGYGIGELGDMNHLAGELEIRGLDNVGGLRDAKSANLRRKQNLTILSLYWDDENIGEVDEEVLEGLEPPFGLYDLHIYSYKGLNFSPSWLVDLGNLVQFDIDGCLKFECLPPLGKLPCLKTIRLWGNDSLKSFHDDDLVSLYYTTFGKDNVLFSRLQKLKIVGSPKLIRLPSNLPKLEVLELGICNGIVSLPDPNGMPSVKSISIEKCLNLTCLPDGMENLNALNSLMIRNCQHLQRRCAKETGEDWPKISHIPFISIYPLINHAM